MTVRRILMVLAMVLVAAACSGEPPSLTAELDPGATAVPEPITPRVCNGVVSLAEQLGELDATNTREVDAIVDRSSATVSAVPVDAPAEVITMLTQISLALSSPDAEIARSAASQAIAAEQGEAGNYLTTTCAAYAAGSLTGGLTASATTSAEVRAAVIAEAAANDDGDEEGLAADGSGLDDDTQAAESDVEAAEGSVPEEPVVIPPTPDGVFEVAFAPGSNRYEGVEFVVTRIVRTISEPIATLAAEVDEDTPSGNWILVGVSFTGSPDATRSFEASDVMLVDAGGSVVRADRLLLSDGTGGGSLTVAPGQTADRVAVFTVPGDVTDLAGWSVGIGRSGQVPETRSIEVTGLVRNPIIVDSGGATGTVRHADEACRNSPDAPSLDITLVQVVATPEPWFVTGNRSALGTRHISVIANVVAAVEPAVEGACAEIDLDVENYPLTLVVDGLDVQSEIDGFGLAELPTDTTLVSAAFVVPANASRMSLIDANGSVIEEWVLNLAPAVGE